MGRQVIELTEFYFLKGLFKYRLVWIKASNLNWNPKPFKVYNYWFGHKDFLDFIKSFWESTTMQGKKYFVLKEKFKILKEKLKMVESECFWLGGIEDR